MTQEGVRNVRVLVVNNGYLGMVRQWQQLFEGKRYSETPLSGPDFAALARAYGWHALTVRSRDDLRRALSEAARHDDLMLIDIQVDREANVFPIVPQGRSIGTMLVDDIAARGEA